MNQFTTLALVAIGCMLLASPAEAQKRKQQIVENVDFSTISCAEFLEDLGTASEDDAGAVLLWLDGYLSGVSGDTVLRFDGLEAFATNLAEHLRPQWPYAPA